jgi:hypothetical protein
MLLYAITTLALDNADRRTPAVCSSLERAKEIVESNEGDIHESYYDTVVIETFLADKVYGYTLETVWYQWNPSGKKYLLIDCPENYKSVCGFGVG